MPCPSRPKPVSYTHLDVYKRQVEISALKGEGTEAAAKAAMAAAKAGKGGELPHVFTGSVEHAIAHIEEDVYKRQDKRLVCDGLHQQIDVLCPL